jgi:hypothetical protein
MGDVRYRSKPFDKMKAQQAVGLKAQYGGLCIVHFPDLGVIYEQGD